MAQHITSVNDLYERTQAMGYTSQTWETYIRSSYLCVQ